MPYTSAQFQELAASPAAEKARRLLAAGRLWKFCDRLDEENQPEAGDDKMRAVPPGNAGAYVMDNDSEPQMVLWNEGEWSCECGSVQPCIHLAVLLIHLAEKHPEDSILALFVENSNEPNAVEEPGLNPQQDLLFFVEPDNVEKIDVLVLGMTVPAGSDSSSVNFTDMKGGFWSLRPAQIIIKENGITGPPRPLSSKVPSILKLPGAYSDLGPYRRREPRNEQGCMSEQAMLATSPRHSLGNKQYRHHRDELVHTQQ